MKVFKLLPSRNPRFDAAERVKKERRKGKAAMGYQHSTSECDVVIEGGIVRRYVSTERWLAREGK